jgi:leader peptidase (prepilin peptidase)/N-methyltransferase
VDPDVLSEASGWAPLLSSPLGVVAAAVFGALWGSFFNVCIARVPRGLSVVRPGSHCFACQAPVRARDNVPILSYFLLRGRCRSCGAQFSARYAAVEALAAGLSALLYWQLVLQDPGSPPGQRLVRYLVGFAFAGVLLVLSFIDLDTKRLPDVITLPAIPVFFLAGFGTGDVPWLDRLIGGAAGYLAVRIIADGYYYITGREGLGLGDGKLLAVIGVLLGWRALPVVVFSASFVGVLVSVPILYRQHRQAAAGPAPATGPAPPAGDPAEAEVPPGDPEADSPVTAIRRTEVPFGPFLALAGLVYLLAGPKIWQWFLERLGGA